MDTSLMSRTKERSDTEITNLFLTDFQCLNVQLDNPAATDQPYLTPFSTECIYLVYTIALMWKRCN